METCSTLVCCAAQFVCILERQLFFGSTLVMLRDGHLLPHNTPHITGIKYVVVG